MNDSGGPSRRSIRLPAFDYASGGAYFVTIVAADRASLFGAVVDGGVRPTPVGRIVEEEWRRTAEVREHVELDQFVVMPNHVHGVLWLLGGVASESGEGTARRAPTDSGRAAQFGKPKASSLSTIVGAFKSAATRRLRTELAFGDHPVWQRGFYERVIRNEQELHGIREYIVANPRLWAEDGENPAHPRS